MPVPAEFFSAPAHPLQRRYEMLRAFFLEKRSAEQVAETFGCSRATVYALTRDFRKLDDPADAFFLPPAPRGRPPLSADERLRARAVALSKRNLSVPEIKAALDAEGLPAPSERVLDRLLKAEGFQRLPRRSRAERAAAAPEPAAPGSVSLAPGVREEFQTERAAGVLCLLPWIRAHGIDEAIAAAGYPGTSALSPLQSVLAFLALKLSGVRRYVADDLWCMDRGLGLFAGLNVLPKTAWCSSYADRTTRAMNRSLLSALARLWTERGLLGDSANLDFTTLPHWGDDDTLQKHWSGSRGRALRGLSVALAQDPDSGLLLRGDAGIRHETGDDAALEFLDFSRRHGAELRYLVFDGRFTAYRNLAELDREGVRFVTLRRRGKKLDAQARAAPAEERRKVRVPTAGGTRLVTACDRTVKLRDYGGEARQISVLDGGHRRPALLITNDFESTMAELLRRYARRWLIEKSISEQLGFFHLNRLNSSMVVKVDFDLTMTLLAYNLYRLLARDLPAGYQRQAPQTLFERLLATGADVRLEADACTVALKKKRGLPALLEAVAKLEPTRIPWLGDRRLVFRGATRT